MFCGLLVTMSSFLPGCQTAGEKKESKPVGHRARNLIGVIEPTGAVRETNLRAETWEAATERLEQIDIEQFNATVARVAELAEVITERINAIDPQQVTATSEDLSATVAALEKKIDDAPLDEATLAVLELAETFDAKTKVLEIERFNLLLAEVKETLLSIKGVVRRVDEHTTQASEGVQDVLGEVKQKLDELPIDEATASLSRAERTLEEVQQTSSQLPQLGEDVSATLATARLALKVLIALLILLGFATTLWIVRQFRKPAAP
jgi:hypothetical protein